MSKYIPLHNHTHFSFLQALPKINELVDRAKEYKLPALAITDTGNMHGAVDFYKACKAADIKPIIGTHMYLAPGTLSEPHDLNSELERIILLAKNEEGYKNLMRLTSKAHTEGFYDVPRIDKASFKGLKGIIAISPMHRGPVQSALSDNLNTTGAVIAEYKELFGDDFYIEITDHDELPLHRKRVERVISVAKTNGANLVAGQESYYLDPDDHRAREVMRRIQQGRGRPENAQANLSFRKPSEMEKAFEGVPEAIENTQKIADACNLEIEIGSWVFPNIITKDGASYEDALRKKTYEGIAWREMSPDDEVVKERIEYELKIIIDKGFAPYFLVVSDLLTESKRKGILTTTRGSAAGSLVSYLTGITNVDPIKLELPFERFLNPERPAAPDIDMDFADSRRDEIIQYAREKYGDDHVAQIGTFGTMMARAAVRDVARALGHPYGMGDRIAKMIPMGSQGFPMTIEKAYSLEPDLVALRDSDEDVAEILELAQKIEGCVRHTGVHAAGVVISPTPLTEWTPLQQDPKAGKLITQYDMHSVEDVGLLKFDFLGIKNLSILADSVHRAKEEYDAEIDIENIPLDDKKTYEMLARGETEGLFQLNGGAMTNFLKQLEPERIEDINAMIALYRPGPMKNIPDYIDRKKGLKKISYLHPKMESYLKRSYGILVYQEDIMLTALNLAGYTWKTVDKLRKAIGKKIPAEMAKQHEIFVEGCKEHSGLERKEAEKIWDLFEPFQGYGFNIAHAASYGKVSYQTAYMKANFPIAYMAALLAADAGDTEKIAILVRECKRMKIEVLPPDINESNENFTIVGESSIRFGLMSIKNFGAGVAEDIRKEREQNGKFSSLSDLLMRVPGSSLNRRGLESLAKCGALDSFAERNRILESMDSIVNFAKDIKASRQSQDSLFGGNLSQPEIRLKDADDATLAEKLKWEKELLGIYISGHPLDAHDLTNARMSIGSILDNPRAGMPVMLPCVIEEVRTILTKKGDKMAFVRLNDTSGDIESVVFPKTFKDNTENLQPGKCLLIAGSISKRNDELSIAIEKMRAL